MVWFDFSPRDFIGEYDRHHGMCMLLYDGACTQVMGVLAGGASAPR